MLACCHFSKRICFLDHLVPICHLFDIPLITDNQELLLTLENYYPPTKSFFTKNIDNTLEPYSALFYAQPSRLFPYGFHFSDHHLLQKKRSIFTYHGFSEKYIDDFWFERFLDEDLVLIHGPSMQKQLQKKGIWNKIKNPIICGNLRSQFYDKHKVFFEKKIKALYPPNSKKKILWAPSWNLGNFSSSSLPLSLIEKNLSTIPEDYELLIKLHPLQEEEWDQFKNACKGHPSIIFIKDCPLVYPLLAEADFLLSDVSSVAYDFLVFNRPMLFFPTSTAPILHTLGRVIKNDASNLFSTLLEKEPIIYSKRRKSWLEKIFAPLKEEECKQSILMALK